MPKDLVWSYVGLSDAEPVSFQLLCDPGVLPPVVCVPALPAPGLATDRQTYLYSKIRPFCSDEAKDITCPAPQSTTQNGTQKRMMVGPCDIGVLAICNVYKVVNKNHICDMIKVKLLPISLPGSIKLKRFARRTH
ncbi:hypothetical protein AMECASPLE_008131 [Ameca splendens]|uniref:Uncharacterized protein n=1 Tax=Ameca splendens TaxID=208324 RepID=A0ABV0XNY5_9TELE